LNLVSLLNLVLSDLTRLVLGIRLMTSFIKLCRVLTVMSVLLFQTACLDELMLFKQDGKVVDTGQFVCHYLNPEYSLHPVGLCKNADTLQFVRGEEKLLYRRGFYQNLLSRRLFDYLKGTNFPLKTLKTAQIQAWIKAPVFDPLAASLVAVAYTESGNFSVDLPFEPEKWEFRAEFVRLLGSHSYPSPGAVRAGVLHLAANYHMSAEGLTQTLEREINKLNQLGSKHFGVRNMVRIEGSEGFVKRLVVPEFAELSIKKRLARLGGRHGPLKEVGLVPAGERDSFRAKGFEFSFAGH